jgi:hypothetical protein
VKNGTINARNQGFIAGLFNNSMSILLACAATIDVILAIVTHWKTYDLLGKFLGIVLLLNLAIVPLKVIKLSKREKGKAGDADSNRIHLVAAGHHSVQPPGLRKN